jgi:methylated-DNA-[protein]-cysteine S-methyltransferase
VTFGLDSPVGGLLVEVGPAGVRSIDFLGRGEAADVDHPQASDGVASKLRAYFDGDVDALDAIPVDLDGQPPFRRLVLETLRDVRGGEVVSYGELAAMAGQHGSRVPRAVGQAVGRNPVPIVVPCHRVVAADGSLGGYGLGLDRKRWLLKHEGVPDRPGGWVARTSRLAQP